MAMRGDLIRRKTTLKRIEGAVRMLLFLVPGLVCFGRAYIMPWQRLLREGIRAIE